MGDFISKVDYYQDPKGGLAYICFHSNAGKSSGKYGKSEKELESLKLKPATFEVLCFPIPCNSVYKRLYFL
jgi:hypothetical protein